MAVLLALVGAADRRYGLYKCPSGRYQLHAIPVAVSYLYHGHQHDYTGYKAVAADFCGKFGTDVDETLRLWVDPTAPVGTDTYFWAADDRGLADYCIAAFRLFGPRLSSLSNLYLLLLGSSVALFVVGYRRRPTAWVVPTFVLLAHLLLIHAYQFREHVMLVDGTVWGEAVSLYEPRVFEVLAALAWFHLALLATAPTTDRWAWVTAIPQAALLLFLYHCRSSLGWEYLALLATAGVCAGWKAVAAFRGRGAWSGPARPAAVAALVVLSVAGLGAYKKAVYHPAYFAEAGVRTFWHNALIGFSYHPVLRDRHHLSINDLPALLWVLDDARAHGDPRCRPEWSRETFIASSVGDTAAFDWRDYEAVAKDVYLRAWWDDPLKALGCYAVYKPKDAARQLGQYTSGVILRGPPSRARFLGVGLLVAAAAVWLLRRPGSDADHGSARAVGMLSAVFLAFSLIPGIAFYLSIATMSGVYLGLTVAAGCVSLGLARWFATRAERRAAAAARAVDAALTGPGFARRNALPFALVGLSAVLLALLYQTDRDLGLYKSPSGRYRYHAMPVAISYLYHNHPHDYTARKYLAWRFQDHKWVLDDLIVDVIANPPVPDPDLYLWAADDRGLGDFCIAAFRLFGPRIRSLSEFYFLLLAAAVGLYAVGYWRVPWALLGPVGVLFGMVVLSQMYQDQGTIAFAGRVWLEEIALYESRLFDLLALVSCSHLALLAASGAAPRAAWLTAVPQAALVLFLYHARSSLGWEYLAVLGITGLAAARWAWGRWRAAEKPGFGALARPAFVAALVVGSLVGLGQYKARTYHPAYAAEAGTRTFWHNALMGYGYNPRLRHVQGMPWVNDAETVRYVFARMRAANDPRLGPDWTETRAMNSLGGHNKFDWVTYEQVAREYYFAAWRDHPAEVAACYGYWKPRDVVRQAVEIGSMEAQRLRAGRSPNLLPALAVWGLAVGLVFAAGRRDAATRRGVRTLFRTAVVFTGCSLIPGIAFYAALVTLSCFYAGSIALAGLTLVRAGWWVNGRLSRAKPTAAPAPVPEPLPTRLAA
jgi:hypothetical protein